MRTRERTIARFFRANAAVGFAFGMALLIAPVWLADLYGFRLNDAGVVLSRLYGGELIGFSTATWLVAGPEARGARRLVAQGHLLSEGLGFLVIVVALLSGMGNALGWALAVAFAVFFSGYAYLLASRVRPLRPGL
jgi:hypothetical protein